MAFDNLAAFLHMGGYARFVWPVWIVALAIIVGFVLHSIQRRKALVAHIKRSARKAARSV